MRTRLILLLAAAVGAIWLATIFLPDDPILNTSISTTITAGMSFVAAMLVIARQKPGGLYGRTYTALAIGLACWFAGEMIWTYDNMIAGKEAAQLSLADIPWLMLYAFFGYHVFKTYQFFGFSVNKYHLLVVVATVGTMTAVTMYSILSALGDFRSPAVAMVRLSYPIGDAVLIVPSVLLLITLRHGLLTYTPWLFSSVALILIAVADILFSNIALFGTADVYRIAFPLYNAGNLFFFSALIWYNKFGIYDKSKVIEIFQERNR
ncbi:MAG: hypothetical protein AB1351_01135 [Thermoproteota archaeon]